MPDFGFFAIGVIVGLLANILTEAIKQLISQGNPLKKKFAVVSTLVISAIAIAVFIWWIEIIPHYDFSLIVTFQNYVYFPDGSQHLVNSKAILALANLARTGFDYYRWIVTSCFFLIIILLALITGIFLKSRTSVNSPQSPTMPNATTATP